MMIDVGGLEEVLLEVILVMIAISSHGTEDEDHTIAGI
jgi:hypothetical protein